MRLGSVKKNVPLAMRIGAGVARVVGLLTIPDVAYVMTHRRALFGGPFSSWLQELLRGESSWSIGERELFASFTARLLRCEF